MDLIQTQNITQSLTDVCGTFSSLYTARRIHDLWHPLVPLYPFVLIWDTSVFSFLWPVHKFSDWSWDSFPIVKNDICRSVELIKQNKNRKHHRVTVSNETENKVMCIMVLFDTEDLPICPSMPCKFLNPLPRKFPANSGYSQGMSNAFLRNVCNTHKTLRI